MTVMIAGYTPHRWSDISGRAICLWTGYPYSHVELVLDDGWCYTSSLRDGGVRRKQIDLDPPWWHLVDTPWVNQALVLEMFAETKGKPYGYLDLFTQHVMRLPWHDPEGYLCSEWIAEAAGLPDGRFWRPGTLMEYARGRLE